MSMKQTAKCKYCGADVFWLKTKTGKNICIEVSSYKGENLFVYGTHIAHIASCPHFQKEKKQQVARVNMEMYRCPRCEVQLLNNGKDIYCSRCGFIYEEEKK